MLMNMLNLKISFSCIRDLIDDKQTLLIDCLIQQEFLGKLQTQKRTKFTKKQAK